MAKELFIANTCDAWHSWSSMEPLGFYTQRSKAVAAIKRHYKYLTGNRMPKELVEELDHHNQTQGLRTNFHIQVEELNKDRWTI